MRRGKMPENVELGQMLFGTGPINHYDAYWATEGLCMLANIIAEKRNDYEYGERATLTSSMGAEPFENDVFIMRSYYWGDCTCGYDEKSYKWEEDNRHDKDCYQAFFQEMHYLDGEDWYKEKEGHKISDECNCVQVACEKFGIDPEAPGGYVHCTCGHKNKWHEFLANNNHTPDCLMKKPNFVYKPTGVEISWYKHAGRGITCNKEEPSAVRWFEVIRDCVDSLESQ
jgi:hypothetical protein